MEAFERAAQEVGLTILARIRFANDASDFTSQLAELAASGAHVIILFCQTNDATRLVDAALDMGIGGDGYLWLGSDAVTNPATMEAVLDLDRRERLFKGLFGLSPAVGKGTAAYEAFMDRARATPPTTGNATTCDLSLDDNGELLWAQDHDDNENTPLECAGSNNQDEGTYAPYACEWRPADVPTNADHYTHIIMLI